MKQLQRRVRASNARREEQIALETARQEAERRRTAWIVATIMNMAGRTLTDGKKMTIDELLRGGAEEKDPEETRRQLVRRHNLTDRYGIA